MNSTKMLQWAADTYSPRYHLGYKQISGSLLSGVEIQELTFQEELLIDHLKIGWNPAALLYKRISFTHLEASGLHVENISSTAQKLLTQKTKENEDVLVIPFSSIGVEALRLTINPFEESGIRFKDGALEGKGIVYYGESIDIDELFLSIDSNLTTIELNGGIDDKEIKVQELKILNIDTLALEDVIKKMISIRLQEKIVEQVEPEIEDYRAGRENFIPKSVSIDSAMVTLKAADHAQVRLNQSEMRVDSLKADIYKMIEYQPDTVQVGNLFLLIDTNLSKLALDSTLEDETITVESFSLHEIDALAWTKILGSLKKDQTLHYKNVEMNNTIASMLPKHFHLKKVDTSLKSLSYDPVFVHSAALDASNVVLDIATLTTQSGTFNTGVVSNFASLSQHGVIKENHIKSQGHITAHQALFETYGLPIKESTFKLDILDIKGGKDQLLVDFNVQGEEILQMQKDQFGVEALSLKNRIGYSITERVLSVENEGNLSTPYVKDIMIDNRMTVHDGVLSYNGKIAPGKFEGLDANYTRLLENLEFTYQGNANRLDVDIDAEGLKGTFISNDFKKGNLTLSTKEDFILQDMFFLPRSLWPSRAALDIHLPLDFTHILPLHANASIRSNLVDMDVGLEYDNEYHITAKTSVPEDSLLRELRNEVNFDAISPLYTDLVTQEDIVHGKIQSKGMHSKVKFNLTNKDLQGDTVLGGAKFVYAGNLDKKMSVEHDTPSVNDFLKQISTIYAFDPPPLNGDLKISMQFTDLKDINLTLNSNSLIYKTENKKEHMFNNTILSLGFSDSILMLNNYQTTFGEQKIFSEKPSRIMFKDGNIELDPLWINNELKVMGKYNMKTQKGEAFAVSDAFKVLYEKSDVTNRVDIRTETKERKTDIKGTITLLEANIHHEMEIKRFSPDSDIVDVKEVKKRESTLFMKNLSTSIKVNTDKPLSFITAKAEVKADADLMIEKTYNNPIGVLGTIKILDGSSYTISNKKFLFKDSTINLLGDPYNPFLDITTMYKTRQSEIMIQIAGDLNNPNITFSSKPHMSRKRILSTILFDVQDHTENISEENMLLMMGGSMSRSLFSNIGGETIKYVFSSVGINIDKLPFIGRSWDANQSKNGFFTFFSSDDEPEIPSHTIRFKGQKFITEKKLQKAMGVDRKNIFAFWKEDNPTIIDRLLPTLESSLQNFYASEGFYNAAFLIDTSETDVTVTIDENEPVKIEDITINSDYEISDLITLKKGQTFRSKEFVSIKKNIMKDLMKDGYCSYDLYSKAYVNKDSHEVNIDFRLKKGEICTFGEITINDFETIDDSVIKSRIRVKEGEPFSTKQIQETYDALYGLNVFDHISVRHDRKFYNVVPVEIAGSEVERPWYFSADVDYTSSDGFRLSTEVKRTNFLGNAKNISLDFTYSRIEKGLELSYFIPAFFQVSDYYFDFISKIGMSEFNYEGFTEEKKYVEALIGYNDEKWSINAGLALEDIDISPRNYLFSKSVEAGNFSPVYPFLNFNYDARDSKIYPKHGYYIGGAVEYGLPYAEENAYFKYSLEGKLIYSFSDITYSAIAKAGIVDYSDENIPESKLFFGGGFDSNRAYGYKEIGVITSPTSYTIEGAATMASFSLEASYPIGENLYAEVFTDNTMLTKEDYDFSGDIITSAGLGMGYRTPLGQIKLDVGMNVRDPSIYEVNLYIGQSF
jgi:translocation and assembly module TamA